MFGIISDSHDDSEAVKKAVSLFNEKSVTAVFHCGDLISPIMISILKNLKCPFYYALGNNDGEKIVLHRMITDMKSSFYAGPATISHENLKIAMMHEPFAVDALAESGHFDLILYGHTHKLHLEQKQKSVIINPGESCGLLNSRKTAVIYHNHENIEVIDL